MQILLDILFLLFGLYVGYYVGVSDAKKEIKKKFLDIAANEKYNDEQWIYESIYNI